ncbi:MAG: YraN family protein [Burkholderiaceae bacterium]
MLFKRSRPAAVAPSITTKPPIAPTTKRVGDAAEDAALDYLQKAGLRLLQRNFKTPGRGGGEVDLILRAPDGTLVFVEVRARRSSSHGGAAGSVSALKQRRIVFAARHYLARLSPQPPCRFDVVSLEGVAPEQRLVWLKAAFDASGHY